MKKAQYWEDGCGQLGKVAFGATGAKSQITESCRFVYGMIKVDQHNTQDMVYTLDLPSHGHR